MGRKLDPTNKVKRGPGKKAKKQQGAETELVKFITDGNYNAHFSTLFYWTNENTRNNSTAFGNVVFLLAEDSEPKRLSRRARQR